MPDSSDLPFGIDVSRYQGLIDWDVIADHDPKVEFVGIRAAISWGYQDPWFKRNWQEAKRVGIPRCAYQVLYPKQNPERQMDHFLTVVGDDLGELPLVLDVELDHDATPNQLRSALYRCLLYLEQKTGKKPIVYSRASFIDYYVTGTGGIIPWLNNYDWWLAQYLASGDEHPGPPALPKGVTRDKVIIHQTADRGKPFGVQSKALDYDRWQGTLASFYQYIGLQPTPPTPPGGPLTLEERVERLEKLAREHGWDL
ncbi:MAG: hypothetical protein JW750_12525 [Anaerolineaceae bacterium]|nr:hypothetical protein [Anaerolineaceae bacterium]